MKLIFSDNQKRKIRQPESILFNLEQKGIYLIKVTAKTQSEKQLKSTDDEDLRVKINGQNFPKLSNKQRYFDSPAAFSGSTSKGLAKTVLFLIWLESGSQNIKLIPDIGADFLACEVFSLSSNQNLPELSLDLNLLSADGDRRDWVTIVLVDASLDFFTPRLILKRRFLDSDDVKVVIDEQVQKAYHNKRQKLWYFVASVIKGEQQSQQFAANLDFGLHYLEFWADRTPKFEKIKFSNLFFKIPKTIQEKIEYKSKQYGFEPTLMLRLAKRESQFDSQAISSMGAKGIFQLTDNTIEEIAKHGLVITDPFNVDQNIAGGFIYFNLLYQRYDGKKDQIEMTLAAWSRGPSRVPVNKPLDWEGMPDETKNLIKDVLGTHDF